MSANKPLQTMEQKRAKYALECITAFTLFDKERQKGIAGCANQLPALIHMNGLGQAMAFIKSKGEKYYLDMYDLMGQWLCTHKNGKVFANGGNGDVLTAITQGSMHEYMRAQDEAQALLEWVKKFAKALLKQEV